EAIPLVEKHDKTNAVGTRSRFGIVTIFSDILAVVVPLAFLTFMVIVWNLDAKKVEGDSLKKWQNAITLLATLFPILFATIVGRLMSEAARWKLEKGSRIGLLEQLMGSLLPLATANSDVSTVYLADPSLKKLSDYKKDSPGLTGAKIGAPRLDDYDKKAIGVRLSIASSVVLLARGILSVVFAHLARGPEILGYVSTIVRNSKFVEVPPNTSWLDAADLSRMIKDERIRHGFTDMASSEEEQQIGVGYQESTGLIGGAAAHEK
ncbi:hypothetical protein CMUS01_15536, partial [Colletotrichum musicola]